VFFFKPERPAQRHVQEKRQALKIDGVSLHRAQESEELIKALLKISEGGADLSYDLLYAYCQRFLRMSLVGDSWQRTYYLIRGSKWMIN
jgi:hypothetical protein